jgi:hypothetical protein
MNYCKEKKIRLHVAIYCFNIILSNAHTSIYVNIYIYMNYKKIKTIHIILKQTVFGLEKIMIIICYNVKGRLQFSK